MLLRRGKSKSVPKHPWDLSSPLLCWADGAPWTVGDSFQGAQIFGSTGSGKSTGSMAAICRSFLKAGYGGLFLTVKAEDRETYTRYVREAGRMDDLLVFSPDNLLRYNFIRDEQEQSPDKTGLAENLTSLIMTLAELGSIDGAGGRDDDRYFRLEGARLARNGLLTLALGRPSFTVADLHTLVVPAPASPEQVTSESWQQHSFCFRCLRAADDAPKTESQRADFELALTYFLNEWPNLSSRTRSVVQSTLTSATDLLSRGAARDMIASPSPNVSPAMMYDGAVMIADFPVLVYRDVARLIQVILKFMWQRHHARRDTAHNARPTFIVCDESQVLLVDEDARFQAISRSTRTAVVYATQSISSYLETLGQQAEPRLHTLLGNLQLRICHQQTDIRTVQYLQELIGRSRQLMASGNSGSGEDWLAPLFGGRSSASAGYSEVWEHEIQAGDVNGLAKGGAPHFLTEAIVYQGGKRFPGGRTWMKTAFRQRV